MDPVIEQAIELLESPNLVWSADFDHIRHHLWAMLKDEQKSYAPYQSTRNLCEALLEEFPVNR
jgi:hypothetical protein